MRFPKELTDLNRWICWRLEPDPKGGKDRKVPYDAKSGKKAATNKPETWCSYEEALAALDKYLFTGLGFVFTEQDGYVGVDIDHCIDEVGTLNDTAKAIFSKAQTYGEYSPSGSGMHLFFKGIMPTGGNKNSKSGVEMYASGRYFTMTGKALPDSADTIADGSQVLSWIHDTYIKAPKAKKPKSTRKRGVKGTPLTDDEVLEMAASADNGSVFTALMQGNWQELYASQSEADMALCCKLAFWTGKNKEQTDRLFRSSKLFRDKWDVKHHASGATYGEETLDKALETVTECYSAAGDTAVFEYDGRYFRCKGENIYPLTNFIIKPIEMIVSEDETQLTADLITVSGEIYRTVFMSTDFINLQRFKNLLNKRTISLSFVGSEGDLEMLKNHIAEFDWDTKTGVKALGLYRHGGRWVYVDANDAMESGGKPVTDLVQLEKHRNITSWLLTSTPLKADELKALGNLLLSYNEPAKAVAILGWCAGCFLKNHLKEANIKFPHLFLIGEAGSGKSNTMERLILPIFGKNHIFAASQVTSFVLMRDSASSNLAPQPLDEFKPSKLDRYKLDALLNHMRDVYDWHDGVRGRADQTMVFYKLMAPLVVAGEESPEETATRERSIELLFSKKDLKVLEHKRAFMQLCGMPEVLGSLGRAILDAALMTEVSDVKAWHSEAMKEFDPSMPSRIVSNLACVAAGLRLVEQVCKSIGFSWQQIFGISLQSCYEYLSYCAKEYLLDGRTSNKGILEQSLEIMARMGLDAQTQWTLLEEEKYVALRFVKFYDDFTKYRRDHAITGECLPYTQFLKQVKNSDLFVEYKQVRFPDISAKAYLLDWAC